MLDMMKMMGKLKEVQEKMKEAQDSLRHITAEGESGAGMVRAIVNGKKEVIALDIDQSLYEGEREIMKDLIVAAVNIALVSVDEKAKEHLKKATDGLLPNIPGMDLNNMF